MLLIGRRNLLISRSAEERFGDIKRQDSGRRCDYERAEQQGSAHRKKCGPVEPDCRTMRMQMEVWR